MSIITRPGRPAPNWATDHRMAHTERDKFLGLCSRPDVVTVDPTRIHPCICRHVCRYYGIANGSPGPVARVQHPLATGPQGSRNPRGPFSRARIRHTPQENDR